MGSIASGTPGAFAYGVRFTNDTGFGRTNLAISFRGEQWRAAGNVATQTLQFSYRVGAALTNSDADDVLPWVQFPSLDFHSPNTNPPSATPK